MRKISNKIQIKKVLGRITPQPQKITTHISFEDDYILGFG